MPSAAPDWIDQPYVRVYLSMALDHPRVWRDPTLLGWWLRSLVAADRYYPAPAPMPPGMPDLTRATLAEDGVLELVEDDPGFFRFHGLSTLRGAVGKRGRIGGYARAANAERVAGRFAPKPAGDPVLAGAGEPRTNGAPDAGALAGDERWSGGAGHQRTSLTTESLAAGGVPTSPPPAAVTTTPGRAPARDPGPTFGPSLPPDDAQCQAPDAHQASHRYWPGVGWRCTICSTTDGPSFRDQVRKHGGPEF